MKRHAFLIMAHNNWYTLEKLIQIIDAPWNDIYLHIDSKSKDFNQQHFLSLTKAANIRLTKRHEVTWGDESQIRAEMELFKASYQNGPYHYYHLLSGSDLPLINAKGIYDFFDDKECNYLHVESDVSPYILRIKRYHNLFRAKWLPKWGIYILNELSEFCQNKIKIDRLKCLKTKYPILGKGHNWCDLTQVAVEKLIEAEEDIREFTKFTLNSDEMYKQIILLNQPANSIGPIATKDIRCIDWSKKGKHPRIFTISDYETLVDKTSDGSVFARKFDENTDREIIDKIYIRVSGNAGEIKS